MKQFITEILEGLLGRAVDNRNRMRAQYERLTPAERKAGYGDSGQPAKDILNEYESDVAQIEKAMVWLEGVANEKTEKLPRR